MLIRFDAGKILSRLMLAAVCLASAAPASAQIYSWRDANGNLVLSNRQQSGSTPIRSFAMPQAEKVRTTPFAADDRSRAYDQLIYEHSRQNGVRADLVRAVMQVESAFDPNARSPKGAMGLMQLMPQTARQLGVKDAYNPAENVRAGVAYLRSLLDRYENNEMLALAAYNAGPGAVDKYDEKVPPYAETRNYVARIDRMVNGTIQRRTSTIYKTTDVVDGRVITRYTDQKPTSGAYEVLGTR
jgi:soluble lytic murein transglycosylase-like protein